MDALSHLRNLSQCGVRGPFVPGLEGRREIPASVGGAGFLVTPGLLRVSTGAQIPSFAWTTGWVRREDGAGRDDSWVNRRAG